METTEARETDERDEPSRRIRWSKSRSLRSKLSLLHRAAKSGRECAELRKSLEFYLPVLCDHLDRLVKSDPLGEQSCRKQNKILKVFRSVLELSITSNVLTRESFHKWMGLIIEIIERDMRIVQVSSIADRYTGWGDKIWWRCIESGLLILNDMLKLSMTADSNKFEHFAGWYYAAHLSCCKRAILKLINDHMGTTDAYLSVLPRRVLPPIVAYLDLALKCARTHTEFFEINRGNYRSGLTKTIVDRFLLESLSRTLDRIWNNGGSAPDLYGYRVVWLRVKNYKLHLLVLKTLLLNFCRKSPMLFNIVVHKHIRRLHPQAGTRGYLVIDALLRDARENWFNLKRLDRIRRKLREVLYSRRTCPMLRYLYSQDKTLKLICPDRLAEDVRPVQRILATDGADLTVKAEALLCLWTMMKACGHIESTLSGKTIDTTRYIEGEFEQLRFAHFPKYRRHIVKLANLIDLFNELRSNDYEDRNFWASIAILDIIGVILVGHAANEPLTPTEAEIAAVNSRIIEHTLTTSSTKLLVTKATDLKLKIADLK